MRPAHHTSRLALLAALVASMPALADLPAAQQAALAKAVQAPVAAHQAAGDMLLVAQDGKTLFAAAAGTAGRPPAPVLRQDQVFWVASMSKPVTAVAILMLAEAGKLTLDDPVSKYVPALHNLQVQVGASTVPAVRDITLRDLLTHTSGIASGMGPPPPGTMPPGTMPPGAPPPPGAEPPPAGGVVAPDVTATDTLATWVPRLAGKPMEHQPGAVWRYSPGAGFDVLSRVVEVASGQAFRAFMTARILTPLGMHDTTYGINHAAGDRLLMPPPRFATDPRVAGSVYTSGAAGLFTSMADYAKFAMMLAQGGVASDGTRLLSAASVADLSSNHVGALFPGVLGRKHMPGQGFGYGVAIVLDPAAAGIHVPAGSYGWDGAGGSRFWVSPAQHRVLVEFGNPDAQATLEAQVEAALH